MTIRDRYSRAVHSANLKSGDDTRFEDATMNTTDTDVLGAVGYARRRKDPKGNTSDLAMALFRLNVGDNRAAHDVVRKLASMLIGKAADLGSPIGNAEASDIARAVLAWHRDGACRVCGGHGFRMHDSAPMLSDQQCGACKGTRKVAFDVHFGIEQLVLARWVRDEIEREQNVAGPLAMKALSPKLNL